MKALIIITISLISLNLFSAELGEDQKSECPFLNQSAKRDAKAIVSEESGSTKEEATQVISK